MGPSSISGRVKVGVREENGLFEETKQMILSNVLSKIRPESVVLATWKEKPADNIR